MLGDAVDARPGRTATLPETVPVVCFATGLLYGRAELYVNRLHAMLTRHCARPFHLRCYTDRPRVLDRAIEQRDCSGWTELERPGMRATTRKLGLFNPEYVEFERFLYLDLSLVIRRPMDDLLAGAWSRPEPLVIVPHWRHDGYNSSVMCVRRRPLRCLYDAFAAGESHPQQVPGDQDFIRAVVQTRGLQDQVARFPREQIISFKKTVQIGRRDPDAARALFAGATIVKFHGQPKMHEAFGWRYRLHRRVEECLHAQWRPVAPLAALQAEWAAPARLAADAGAADDQSRQCSAIQSTGRT